MPNPLEVVVANQRSGGRGSRNKRSFGTAIMDTLTQGSAERGPNGLRIVRSAIVTGLTGPPEGKIPDALNAVGLPRYGDPHPSPLAAGIPLSLMTAEILEIEPDKAIVTLTYEFPTASGGINVFENEPSETAVPQIEVTTTLNQLTTNRDANGNTMTVTYVQDLLDEEGNAIGSDSMVQGGEVVVMVPTTTINYMRREPLSPLVKARRHVGTTNSMVAFGDPERYWLCTGLGGPSDDGGITYNVTYSFQRAEPHEFAGAVQGISGWDAVVVYIDPETGKPPGDLLTTTLNGTDTGGVDSFVIYKSTNFNQLFLTVP